MQGTLVCGQPSPLPSRGAGSGRKPLVPLCPAHKPSWSPRSQELTGKRGGGWGVGNGGGVSGARPWVRSLRWQGTYPDLTQIPGLPQACLFTCQTGTRLVPGLVSNPGTHLVPKGSGCCLSMPRASGRHPGPTGRGGLIQGHVGCL